MSECDKMKILEENASLLYTTQLQDTAHSLQRSDICDIHSKRLDVFQRKCFRRILKNNLHRSCKELRSPTPSD